MDDKQNIGRSNISGGLDAKLMYENVPPFTGFTFYSGSQYQPGSTVSVTPKLKEKLNSMLPNSKFTFEDC